MAGRRKRCFVICNSFACVLFFRQSTDTLLFMAQLGVYGGGWNHRTELASSAINLPITSCAAPGAASLAFGSVKISMGIRGSDALTGSKILAVYESLFSLVCDVRRNCKGTFIART
jgi:hypothetical protein